MSIIKTTRSKLKNPYTYKTVTDKNGNVERFRCWDENFKDEDSENVITIKRHQLIKLNGEKVVWFSNSELKQMSKKQLDSIQLKYKKTWQRKK